MIAGSLRPFTTRASHNASAEGANETEEQIRAGPVFKATLVSRQIGVWGRFKPGGGP
jgi:hypothetical protein